MVSPPDLNYGSTCSKSSLCLAIPSRWLHCVTHRFFSIAYPSVRVASLPCFAIAGLVRSKPFPGFSLQGIAASSRVISWCLAAMPFHSYAFFSSPCSAVSTPFSFLPRLAPPLHVASCRFYSLPSLCVVVLCPSLHFSAVSSQCFSFQFQFVAYRSCAAASRVEATPCLCLSEHYTASLSLFLSSLSASLLVHSASVRNLAPPLASFPNRLVSAPGPASP